MAKIAFVLGAGASLDFGLPTGPQLLDEIAFIARMQNADDGWHIPGGVALSPETFRDTLVAQCGRDRLGVLMNAGRRLSAQQAYSESVDDLLYKFGEDDAVVEVGKLAIVAAILAREGKSRLSKFSDGRPDVNARVLGEHRANWLFRLLTRLLSAARLEDVPDLLANVCFVNFNYDRCLEHFVYFYIQEAYSVAPGKAVETLQALEVHRPYGVIGGLPWREGHTGVQFGMRVEAAPIDRLRENIRTLNDPHHEDDALDRLRAALHSAERVVFLGFGFHRQNMSILGDRSRYVSQTANAYLAKHPIVFGTAYKVSAPNQGDIAGRICRQFSTDQVTISGDKCEGLIQDYPWLG